VNLQADGIEVLLPLYPFEIPKLLGRVTRGGNFKTKALADPVDAYHFLHRVVEYYGGSPTRITAEYITSWPVEDAPFGSQLWHRDTEGGARCVRAMVYLTDVTIDDGPLCYAPDTRELDLGSNRVSDEEFAKHGLPTLTLTGPKGTAILFDIMGYHKGLPNVKGRREALCFTYYR